MRFVTFVFAALAMALLACNSSTSSTIASDGGSDGGCLPVPTATQVSCAPTTSGDGCKGIPKDPWDRASKPTRTSETFPVGCRVVFPHENPYYRCSGGQDCSCSIVPDGDGGTTFGWSCPL